MLAKKHYWDYLNLKDKRQEDAVQMQELRDENSKLKLEVKELCDKNEKLEDASDEMIQYYSRKDEVIRYCTRYVSTRFQVCSSFRIFCFRVRAST